MKVKKLGTNVRLLTTNHGDEILYSCETPVAGYSALLKNWFVTNNEYDAKTTKHISKYLGSHHQRTVLTPEEIELLFLNNE